MVARVSESPFTEVELRRVAEMYGTPAFLVDEATLGRLVTTLREAYSEYPGELELAYSMKANFNPAILRYFIERGLLFDITSLGELYFYLNSGGDPKRVIYTSIAEGQEELLEAARKGVKTYVVSSYNGLKRVIDAAKRTNTKLQALIRVNPGIEVTAEISASLPDGKFGVPLEGSGDDTAGRLVETLMGAKEVEFLGYHFHLGSQIAETECFKTVLSLLADFTERLRITYPDLKVGVIDVGGGTPVRYLDPVPTPQDIGRVVVATLNRLTGQFGGYPKLIVESGRYLTAEACSLVTKVVNIKQHGERKFIFVDAGYHLLLDVALLRQEYPVQLVDPGEEVGDVKPQLVGSLCDTIDTFPVRDRELLRGAQLGSLIAFHRVGAYSVVFNMPFHCSPKPPIVMKRVDGKLVLVRERESLEELFRSEGGRLAH